MIELAETSPRSAPPSLTRSITAFHVEVTRDWHPVSDWRQGAGTTFQDTRWLGTWYATLAGRAGLTPLLVTVRAADGTLALRLPLVVRRLRWLTVIEFADLDLTDFNAPLLGPAAPSDPREARAMWRAVRHALPRADFVRLNKMPPMLGARPNPLAALAGAMPSNVNGNRLEIGDDYEAWRRSLEKTVRKELERSWRVFTREPETRFAIVTDLAQARPILDALETQQSLRLRAKGEAYALDDPAFAAFYRKLVENELAGGFAVLSALIAGDAVVAALLGVRDAHGLVMVRISTAGGRWNNCSPGRLVIERTLRALHADGCRVFDFSIGNYDYKRRFGVTPTPLVNLTQALRVTGWPAVLRAAASAQLRRHPALDGKVRALLARASTQPG